MKFYSFGKATAPVIMLLPGTCCHWKSNFAKVIPLLADTYHVLCVSYDGFDKTEETEFTTMLEETEKIENYIREYFSGHIRAAYGCSLGGSFVGLLTARKKIHIDYGILGSSNLDQASPLAAKLQTGLLLPMIYPVIRDEKCRFAVWIEEYRIWETMSVRLWKCSAAHGHILRSEAVEISFTLTLLRLCPMELM